MRCTFFVALWRRDPSRNDRDDRSYRESFAAVPGLEVHPGSLSRRRCGSRWRHPSAAKPESLIWIKGAVACSGQHSFRVSGLGRNNRRAERVRFSAFFFEAVDSRCTQ